MSRAGHNILAIRVRGTCEVRVVGYNYATNEADSAAAIPVVYVYGPIGTDPWWSDESTGAREFVDAISAIQTQTLDIRISSDGGVVSDALVMANAIARHPATIRTFNDGLVASSAGLLLFSGNIRTYAANSLLMIHAPWLHSTGNAAELRQQANMLDQYAEAMALTYAGANPDAAQEFRDLLRAPGDQWFTAAEANARGWVEFIDARLSSPLVESRIRKFISTPAAQAAFARINPEDTGMPLPDPVLDGDGNSPLPKAQGASPPHEQGQVNAASQSSAPQSSAPPVGDAMALLADRNAAIGTRAAAFIQANPAHAHTVRECQIAALASVEDTLDAFTQRVLAAIAQQHQQQPVAGASAVSIELTEDSRDKVHGAIILAQLARSSLHTPDGKLARVDASNPYRGMTYVQMAADCLVRGGMPANRVMRMAPMELVAAALTQSASDFPVLFEGLLHKALLGGYAIASDTWRRFCAVGSVSDFRPHYRYRTGALGNLQPLNELAEYQNADIPDGTRESVGISTRGLLINLSRKALINDDQGALVGVASGLGRSTARTIETDVHRVVLLNGGHGPLLNDGKPVIHVDHNNLVTDEDYIGAPSVDTYEHVIWLMTGQMDRQRLDYLDLRPELLLAPNLYERRVRTLNTAEFDPDLTGDTGNINTPNPYRNQFRDLITTRRMTGVGWYVLADPQVAPVYEVSFLNGEQQPVLDQDIPFNVDGVRWKVRADYGVGAVGHEGIVFNPGIVPNP